MRGKRIDRFTRICAPALLLPFIPPLCTKEAWPTTVKLTIFIALFLILAERLFRMALAALAEPPSMPSCSAATCRAARPAPCERWGAAGARSARRGNGAGGPLAAVVAAAARRGWASSVTRST